MWRVKSKFILVVTMLFALSAQAYVPLDADNDYLPYRTISYSSSSTTTSGSSTSSYEYNYRENDLFDEVNNYRRSKGLRSLSRQTYLSKKAEEHVDYMIAHNEPSHDNFPYRASNIMNRLDAEAVGENVAYAYYSSYSVVNAWENSYGHRRNMEKNWTHFGVSVKRHPSTGRYYYMMIFARL